jgi:transposase InsO family protein
MSNFNLESWLLSQNYPPVTANLIRHIINSPPSRKVRSGIKNVSGFYPSIKCGVTIQFESHKNELCFIVQECEYNDLVLFYVDQPPAFTVNYKAPTGRNLGHIHTPDFFAIRLNTAGWIECKTAEKLEELFEENPNKYMRDANGEWHFLPGEEYAKRYGLFYEVFSSDQIDPIRQRNYTFLEDYLRIDNPQAPPEARNAIRSLIKANHGITLSELLDQTQPFVADDIYTLVASSDIFIDLSKYPIKDIHHTRLFLDQEMAEAYSVFSNAIPGAFSSSPFVNIAIGSSVMWDGIPWEIMNVGNTLISMKSANCNLTDLKRETFDCMIKDGRIYGLKSSKEESEAQKILNSKRKDYPAMQKALTIHDAISPFINGNARTLGIKANRSVRRHIAKFELAQIVYGEEYGLLGLFDETNPGRPGDRISDGAKDLIKKVRVEFYETGICRSKKAAYGKFLILCEQKGVAPVSWKSFRKYLKKDQPLHETKRKREGDRAAYNDEPFHFYLDRTIPPHGDRPFEICHIDHTELDLETVSSEVNMNLGRPWLTTLTDAYSRKVFAFYLTYNKPSYISCEMVLRECVARYGRLPQIIVVDGGAEFRKVEFDLLLARYQIIKKVRPSAKARFGSPCERMFGVTNTELVHNLTGNTKLMKNVRQITKRNNPKNLAIWPLEDFYPCLEKYLYEEYDTDHHPTLDESPRDAFDRGIQLFGKRQCRFIPYDDDFIHWTLPRPRKTHSRIDPTRGVKINSIWYYCPQLFSPKYSGVIVERRYDPVNVAVAYVLLDNTWVECSSQYRTIFNGRSHYEIKLLSADIRQRKILAGRRFELSARDLALRCQTIEQKEEILKQRQKDRAMDKVHAAMAASRRGPSKNTCSDSKPTSANLLSATASRLNDRTTTILAEY